MNFPKAKGRLAFNEEKAMKGWKWSDFGDFIVILGRIESKATLMNKTVNLMNLVKTENESTSIALDSEWD